MEKLNWNYGAEGFAFSSLLAVAGSFFNYCVGGWDGLLNALCFMMAADFAVGIMAAAKRGEIDSQIMLWGGAGKLLVLVLVAVGNVLDGVLPLSEPYVRTAVIWFYMGREGLSLVENYGKMGQKPPDFLKRILGQLQEQNEDKKDK